MRLVLSIQSKESMLIFSRHNSLDHIKIKQTYTLHKPQLMLVITEKFKPLITIMLCTFQTHHHFTHQTQILEILNQLFNQLHNQLQLQFQTTHHPHHPSQLEMDLKQKWVTVDLVTDKKVYNLSALLLLIDFLIRKTVMIQFVFHLVANQK